MRQVLGRRGRMPEDRCALAQGSVLSPWSLEASSVSHLAGHALDTPSCRASRACEESAGLLVALNNLHSPGD